MRKTQLIISREALTHNLQLARKLAPASQVFAVIKSNAYGHGLTETAKILQEADGLAVAITEEAVAVRQELDLKAGARKDILILQGFMDKEEAKIAQELDCIGVIHHKWQAELTKNLSQPVRAWLKINTGMNRLGMGAEEIKPLLKIKNRGLQVEAVMTHFASANQQDKQSAQIQINRFHQATRNTSLSKSLANSAALLSLPNSHADINRPGLMLYGASPLDDVSAESLDLVPAMTLSGEIISVRKVCAGEGIGYDATWRAPYDCYVGVVSLGYGDGYPRLNNAAAHQVPVFVNGNIRYLAGRVSMDSLCINLGAINKENSSPQASIGDKVIFWGKDLPIEKVAEAVGRSAYDLLAGLTARLRRVYCD